MATESHCRFFCGGFHYSGRIEPRERWGVDGVLRELYG